MMLKKGLKLFFGFIGLSLLILIIGLIWHFYFPAKHIDQFPTYGDWDNGQVQHILPAANHNTFLLKVSFKAALTSIPQLQVGDTLIKGTQNDPKGRFWQFHITDLQPQTTYSLTIQNNNNQPLSDSWPLTTFPHPDSTIQNATILTYTCAGGVEDKVLGQEIFNTIAARHALLQKGLTFKHKTFDTDFVIANGDHLYWDQASLKLSKARNLVGIRFNRIYGELDMKQPVLSETNYDTFTNICDAQIAELYGCLFRSTPVYFLSDDHDLFENDEATQKLVTLPPKPYMLNGAIATQKLYYPTFLSDTTRPTTIPSTENGLTKSFGSIRYGNLIEGLLYDCKRHTTLDGDKAVLIPKEAEQWIMDRTSTEVTTWLFQIPSSPVGWTAGKWSEWYPDVFQADGTMGVAPKEKYLWQKGWWLQHQRLLQHFSKQSRKPIILQGDLHIISYGLIQKSGNLDFSANPIHVIGTGPLGSGAFGFPSAFRGTLPLVPDSMKVEAIQPPLEKNGFTIIEVTPKELTVSIYAWLPKEGIDKIKDLKPLVVKKIKR